METARSAEEALDFLKAQKEDEPIAVVIADIFLPGMSGIELLKQFAKISPDTVRIALTGDPSRDTVVESVNRGNIFRFVSKPVRIETLRELVEAAVQRYDESRVERDMMETTVRTSVNLLLEVLATLDPSSFEISQRIRGSVRLFARAMKLPNASELELAVSLARIGTVALPVEIRQKVARKAALMEAQIDLLGGGVELGVDDPGDRMVDRGAVHHRRELSERWRR